MGPHAAVWRLLPLHGCGCPSLMQLLHRCAHTRFSTGCHGHASSALRLVVQLCMLAGTAANIQDSRLAQRLLNGRFECLAAHYMQQPTAKAAGTDKLCHTQDHESKVTGMLAYMYGAIIDVLFLQVWCWTGIMMPRHHLYMIWI